MVKIEGEGFDELRPGMSAEVDIHVETHRDVTRVPLQAVREVQGQSFVAVPRTAQSSDKGPRWRWLPVKIGVSDQTFAEVLDGLKPGDRVIADPTTFPAPAPVKPARTTVARANPEPGE